MKRALVYVAAAVAAAMLAYVYASPAAPLTPQVQVPLEPVETARTVQVGGLEVRIHVANTSLEHQRGLSGREGLAPDEGMLFVFPEDGKYAFWMKDMRFSIDILWLAADGSIIYMAQGVSPDTYPANFAPPEPARYVLELPAGFVSTNNVSIGDIVRL